MLLTILDSLTFLLFVLFTQHNNILINGLSTKEIINNTDLYVNDNNNSSNKSYVEEDEELTTEIIKEEAIPYIKHSEAQRFKLKEDGFLDKALLDLNLKYCQRPARCYKLNQSTCFGAKLPYDSSTLDLTDLKTQEEVEDKLKLYEYLKYIPKCWAVIQPFLCALYMPKCKNGTVDLPSREMCKITLGPCKIFYNTTILPELLKCNDERLFPSKCKNVIHELKFNTTGQCMDPLIKTEQPDWFYPDIEGCGLRCKDALYTQTEHNQIHKLVAYCVLLCIFLNLFTIVTFMIDWSAANKYPALAIFYINICFLVSYSGWLIQFLGYDTREDVVCKKDGTLRKSEPSASENLSCVVVFVMVYYFFIAGLVWFVIFTYAWHMSSLQALGKIQERVDKRRAYFHLVAWSVPLMFTITTMALGEIDGDYVTGICFVGFVNSAPRTGLLLAPLSLAMLVSGYIITKGLILLVKVKILSRDIISAHSSGKIRSNIVRMGVFALFMVLFWLITIFYHGYKNENVQIWEESLHSYILCKLTSLSFDWSHCRQEFRPSVAMLQLQLLAAFGAGIAMASWIWCTATLHAWTRYVRKKFHCEIEEPMKVQKHKIIAEAFAQRKKFNDGGRISIECQNHTDPVGLHFDLNSAPSNELSTTWAANLPRLVNRRGAVPNDLAYSISSNNQSIDSEMSYSVRHVSIESRRNSGDSQLSVQIAELKATRKVNGRRHRNNRYRHKKHDIRRGSRDILNGARKLSRRQSSNTSIDSNLGVQILNALTSTNDMKKIVPNLNRRTGNAGLDSTHINNLLSNGKLVIPYNKNVKSGSEDENVSVTISESKFNVVLSNHGGNNLDLNDQLMMKSLREGLNIQEIDTSDTDNDSKRDVEKHYSLSDRDSKISKKSKKLRRRRSNHYDTFNGSSDKGNTSDSSSCPELKQLLQSSLNSGASVGYCEKSRGSKQSKTSNDVACQASARDINAAYDQEMKNFMKSSKDFDDKPKSKQSKIKLSKKFKSKSKNDNKYDNKYVIENDTLLNDKHKAKIKKNKDIY